MKTNTTTATVICPATRANSLTKANTGFSSFDEMLNAKGSYRPSMEVSQPEMKELADLYDAAQEARGDDRRAFRYGKGFDRSTRPAQPRKPATVAAPVVAKPVTTRHGQIGYKVNVDIIAQALHNLGYQDDSHMMTALAAHVWSLITGSTRYNVYQGAPKDIDWQTDRCWSREAIGDALHIMRARLDKMTANFAR